MNILINFGNNDQIERGIVKTSEDLCSDPNELIYGQHDNDDVEDEETLSDKDIIDDTVQDSSINMYYQVDNK